MKELTDEQLIERVERCRVLLNDCEATETEYFDLARECYGWMVTVGDGSPPAVPDTSTWNGQDARRRIEAFVHHSCFALSLRLSQSEQEREALKASVEGDLSSAIANMTRFGPDVCIACAEPHQWLVFGVRIDDRDGSVVEES